MKLLNKYITASISSTFFPIFLSLFSITSVVYLVRIASLTSVITINFPELAYLYLLAIPNILYYTLPVTFFIAMIMTFSKLSTDYELMVLTSFGQSPLKLLKIIVPLSFLFSLAIFFVSFILIPQSDYFTKAFVAKKQQEAEFNIKPSEYGQSFGPWYIYVSDKQDKKYYDITLFQPTKNQDIFIKANSADVSNDKNVMGLKLYDGSLYTITKTMKQVDFAQMDINNQIKESKTVRSLGELTQYWMNYKTNDSLQRVMIKNILVSLLPLISVLFFLSFGYYNPRYEKSNSTIYAVGLVVIYFIVLRYIADQKEFSLIFILPLIWIASSIFLYRKRVLPYY